jgi:mannosyltransferase OCH1-like enzyme
MSCIPKIIHQIWIGPNKCPDIWINTWKIDYIKKFPDWTYKLWTEKEIEKLKPTMINRQYYDMETLYEGKADIARYEILYQEGGIYIDADSIWLNGKDLQNLCNSTINKSQTNSAGIFAGKEGIINLAQLHDENSMNSMNNMNNIITSSEQNRYITLLANGVMGATKGNKIILEMIEHISKTYINKRVQRGMMVYRVTDPNLLTYIARDSNITIFPTHYFYPIYWHSNHTKLLIKDIEVRYPDSYMFQYGYTTNGLQQFVNNL